MIRAGFRPEFGCDNLNSDYYSVIFINRLTRMYSASYYDRFIEDISNY